MDESSVREHAEAHGKATVAGDLNRAGQDLTKEAMAGAGDVMKAMPKALKSAEIESVEPTDDGFSVLIRYSADDEAIVVRSRWVDKEGRPKIVELGVV